MKSFLCQRDMLEASLRRLRTRFPDAPIQAIMLTRLLHYLGRGMTEMLERDLRPSGLAEAEFRVLHMLFCQPDGVAHPGDLCAHTAQRPANMSRITDALVQRDLITRVASAADRRRQVLRITVAGEALVHRLLPRLFAPLRELFAGLTDLEQQRLIAQLERLGERLDAALSKPAAGESGA